MLSRKQKSIMPVKGIVATLTHRGNKNEKRLPVIGFAVEEKKYRVGNRIEVSTSVEPLILDKDGVLDPADLDAYTVVLEVGNVR